MKRLIFISLSIVGILLFSCELDNFDGPDATIFGNIIDQEGIAVQSDPTNQGSKIIYIESGDYISPDKQSLRLMTDGTYRNDAIFSGTYDFIIRDANFVDLDTVKNYIIKPGQNELDFIVQPYIKITNLKITKSGSRVVAKFNLKTLGNNTTRVDKIQLFTYLDKIVGFGANFTTSPSNEGVVTLNRAPGLKEDFTLEINISKQGDTFSKYPTSTKFWFRVGAMVLKADASMGSNPKWNYSEPIQLYLND